MTDRTPGKRGCTGRRKGGKACDQIPIKGTDRCKFCCGIPLHKQRAKGEIVLELRRWGLQGEELRDPGNTLLQLMTQSAIRVEFYSSLLQEAYEAAERLRVAGHTDGELPDHADNDVDEQRAIEDLDRVFATGGVAALIGIKWGSAGKDGHLFQAEEGIRGLVRLEADERDRCAGMAAKAIAAGLAERQVRLAEQQGQLVAEVIRAMLTDLGHDPADPAVQRVVSTRLHALAGGAA
jgi:hypothetical protein